MNIQKIAIKELNPATYNPRQINEEDFEKLKKSLKEWDLVEPVVVNKDMTIIGGHQRVKAAIAMGWDEIDCNVVNLDKKAEKLLNLALNKITGEWNYELLYDLIIDLPNDELKLAGFEQEEIKKIKNLLASLNDDDISLENMEFEDKVRGAEFRVLLPQGHAAIDELREEIHKLKVSFPDCIIKEQL